MFQCLAGKKADPVSLFIQRMHFSDRRLDDGGGAELRRVKARKSFNNMVCVCACVPVCVYLCVCVCVCTFSVMVAKGFPFPCSINETLFSQIFVPW